MPEIVSQLPALDTLPGLLLLMTAFSGEFPATMVSRLPGADTYKEFAVKRLKRDKLIRSFYRDGLRGLRLTSAAKKMLLTSYPDWFQSALTGNTETNFLKSEITRRLRLHRMAEVLVLMNNIGISIFPWEKPAIFQATPIPTEFCFGQPAYYSSREVKEIGPQSSKIRGSRATGILLTDGGIFVVYNTAATEMKWEYKAEMRFKALLQIELCQQRLPTKFRNAPQDAIVFGSSMKPMEWLMGIESKATRSFFVLDGNFEHFYYLTNDHHGEVLLQLLCEPELKSSLDEILMENLSESRAGWPIVNDGFDESEAPVLFGYTCDMPRIKHFDTALSLHNQTGTLICFDFQEETMRRICGPRVSLQCIDFNAVERSVLHIPEEPD